MSEKVNVMELNSANVKYDNSVDTERVYDIEANANLSGYRVVSMDGGVVRLNGEQKASFNMYGDHQQNYVLNGVVDIEEQCTILKAINAFIGEVESAVKVSLLNL